MSVNSTNPSQLFGGTWEQISGRFLYCTTTSKTTGGSTITGSTTLTINQIPSHNHYIKQFRGGAQWDTGWLWARAAGDSGNAEGGQGRGPAHSCPHRRSPPPPRPCTRHRAGRSAPGPPGRRSRRTPESAPGPRRSGRPPVPRPPGRWGWP